MVLIFCKPHTEFEAGASRAAHVHSMWADDVDPEEAVVLSVA